MASESIEAHLRSRFWARRWGVLCVLAMTAMPQAGLAQTETSTSYPRKPFRREDARALRFELRGAEEALARAKLEYRKNPSTESRKTVSDARLFIQSIRKDLQVAESAPPAEALQKRAEYERLLARLRALHAELKPGDSDPEQTEGDKARAIRVSEQGFERLQRVQEEFLSGYKSLATDEATETERINELIRLQDEKITLLNKISDYLEASVFSAFVEYEQTVAKAIETQEALQSVYQELGLAARYPSPVQTPSEALRLHFSGSTGIKQLWRDRRSESKSAVSSIRKYEGLLAAFREELEQRKIARERRLVEMVRMRSPDLAKTQVQAEPTVLSTSEYAQLGKRIDLLNLRTSELVLEKSQLIEEKEQTEIQLAELAERRNTAEAALRNDIQQEEKNRLQKQLQFPNDRSYPRLLSAFVRSERLSSEKAAVEAKSKAVRRTEVMVDILEQRIKNIEVEASQIRDLQVPHLRKQYYYQLFLTFIERSIRILIVLFIAWLGVKLVRRANTSIVQSLVASSSLQHGPEAIRQQRTRTIVSVLFGAARFLVYLLAAFFIVGQLDIDYGPLLVAAGGLSLAVGFGAQSLVKDFFAGFFILLEGQYSIGDVVELNGRGGVVEDLNLRTTVLRSLNGEVHVIPNGEISATINRTKSWARSVLDIGVAYEEDVDEVMSVLRRIGLLLIEDELWSHRVRHVDVLGVESLADSSVILRVLVETRAGDQWAAGREYLRRVKLAFDELGIEIPWPQRVVTPKEPSMDHAAVAQKRKAIRRYVGASKDPDAADELHSVEERDRTDALAQKEAKLLEQAKLTPESIQSETQEEEQL